MINPNFINTLSEIHLNQFNNKQTNVTKQMVEFAKQNGFNIEMKYGTKQDGMDLIVGYYIIANNFQKFIFIPDVWVEDESESNIEQAKQWLLKNLNKLKN